MKTKKNYRGERQTLSRQALLDAAEQLLAERGTARVSIDDIVDKAGVAKGTFYNHFKDKADIAFEVAAAIVWGLAGIGFVVGYRHSRFLSVKTNDTNAT